MNTTTTTTTTTHSSDGYPHKFLVIQIVLGITTLLVLIALIFLIWYRFFKKIHGKLEEIYLEETTRR